MTREWVSGPSDPPPQPAKKTSGCQNIWDSPGAQLENYFNRLSICLSAGCCTCCSFQHSQSNCMVGRWLIRASWGWGMSRHPTFFVSLGPFEDECPRAVWNASVCALSPRKHCTGLPLHAANDEICFSFVDHSARRGGCHAAHRVGSTKILFVNSYVAGIMLLKLTLRWWYLKFVNLLFFDLF